MCVVGFLSDDIDEAVTASVTHPSLAQDLQGRDFVGSWFQIDPDRAEAFRRGSYFDAYAHPYPLGEGHLADDVIAGFHLVSLLDVLLNQVVWSDGPWLAWNYGSDRVRFVTPVEHSDVFRIRGKITEVVDRGDGSFLLVFDLVGEVRGREQPGFVVTLRVLWLAA
jgi:acyl dehydratase